MTVWILMQWLASLGGEIFQLRYKSVLLDASTLVQKDGCLLPRVVNLQERVLEQSKQLLSLKARTSMLVARDSRLLPRVVRLQSDIIGLERRPMAIGVELKTVGAGVSRLLPRIIRLQIWSPCARRWVYHDRRWFCCADGVLRLARPSNYWRACPADIAKVKATVKAMGHSTWIWVELQKKNSTRRAALLLLVYGRISRHIRCTGRKTNILLWNWVLVEAAYDLVNGRSIPTSRLAISIKTSNRIVLDGGVHSGENTQETPPSPSSSWRHDFVVEDSIPRRLHSTETI